VSIDIPPISPLTHESFPTPLFYPRVQIEKSATGGSGDLIIEPNDLQEGGDTLPLGNDKNLEEIRKYQRRLDRQRALLDRQQQQLNAEYARLGEEASRLSLQSIPHIQDINVPELTLQELVRTGGLSDSAQREKMESIMTIIQEKNKQRNERIEAFMRRQDVSPDAKKEFMRREQKEMQRMDENLLRGYRYGKPVQPMQLETPIPIQLEKPLPLMRPLYKPRVLAVKPFVPATVKSILADLQAEKIATDTLNLSFTLNATLLIVNGVQQPTGLHDKFKEKYIKEPDAEIIYSRKGSGTSLTIHDINTK
jgi:hypothetical protein